MPDKKLFEYAVLRIVPRVEREEFLNVGVIVYCRDLKFLQVKFTREVQKILVLDAGCDLEVLNENLHSFEKIASGEKDAGPISQLEIASRFRWLTAWRSTMIQTSRVHSGLCKNPSEILEYLFEKMVE